jgi:hypothetical protein
MITIWQQEYASWVLSHKAVHAKSYFPPSIFSYIIALLPFQISMVKGVRLNQGGFTNMYSDRIHRMNFTRFQIFLTYSFADIYMYAYCKTTILQYTDIAKIYLTC